MKKLLISTALFTAPYVGAVSAQTATSTHTKLISEQKRQITELKTENASLRSLINLERRKNGKAGIPVSSATAAKSYNSTTSHTVKSGDTFSKISKNTGVSIKDLIAANPNVKPSNMKLGHKLVIPRSSAKTATKKASFANTGSTTISSSSSTYKVAKGDTFYNIAKHHGISLASLSAANPGLNPSKLSIGQTIRLTKSTSSTSVKKTSPKAVKTAKSSGRAYKQLPKVVQNTTTPTKKTLPQADFAKPVYTITPKSKPVLPEIIPTMPEPTESYVQQSGKVARTVPVSYEMTYGAFARQHGTNIAVLNTLNGLDLPADEPMAAGSELFIPIR